ncbi:MAG: hypothetical protein WD278_13100, partial [Pirellulales bacterium]
MMRRRRSSSGGWRPAPQQAPADRPWQAFSILSPWCLALLLLVGLAGCVEIDDPDIWWHLRTGQLILERGEIPRTDWFTYTNPDSPWIDLHWGFQLLAAGLWALGGAPALVLAKSLLGALSFALLLAAQPAHWPRRHAVACLLPSALIYVGRNQVRPEMLSILLLAATLAIIFHAHSRPRLAWLLPAVQLVWVNVHGLFILGLVAWAVLIGQAAVRRFWTWGASEAERGAQPWRIWLPVTVLMIAATLANPYGYKGAMFPLVLLARIQGPQRDFYRQFAGEFDGLSEFIDSYGPMALVYNLTTSMLLVLFFLGAASFACLLVRGRLSLYRLAMFAAFAYLGWQANRNSVLFALVGGLALRANVGEIFEAAGTNVAASKPGRIALAVLLALAIIGVPSDALTLWSGSESSRRFELGEAPSWFCHEAARFLGRPGMPQNVYAVDQGPAAVYIFHNGPARRVFADGRLEVNTRETLQRYLLIARQLGSRDPALLANLTRDVQPGPNGEREVPALLIDLRTPLWLEGPMADPRFQPVFYDDAAIVFLTVERAERLNLPAV